ncbi:MAG TPA: multidrug effflux MFS transporter [Azonexus sp.]|nr:multidrug effflux MFS transporter [Azonexus sp.]
MKATQPAVLIVLLAFMGLLNSLCSDMLIPALPAMRTDMGISSWQAQQTISLFFFASAFMSLWYGAIADAYGRRRIILFSLVILAISAAASAFPASIETLWWLRIVQGLAAGAGMVISRSILHDLYHGPAAQHLLGRITLLQTLSLIATPVIGAWLSIHFGWRAVFIALSVTAFILAGIYWRWLPETLPVDRRMSLHPGSLARSYLNALRTPRFVRLSVAHVANWTSMAIYVVAAPTIVIQLLGKTATDIYLIYAPVTLGLTLGFLAFPRLLRRMRSGQMLATAYCILGASIVLNLAMAGWLTAGVIHIVPLFIYSFGLAIALPILISGAIEPLRQSAGVAASLQTFLQFAMIALAAGLIAPWLWDSLFSLALGTGILTLLGGLGVYLDHKAGRGVESPAVPNSPQNSEPS